MHETGSMSSSHLKARDASAGSQRELGEIAGAMLERDNETPIGQEGAPAWFLYGGTVPGPTLNMVSPTPIPNLGKRGEAGEARLGNDAPLG